MYVATVKYTHVHRKTNKKSAIFASKTQEIGLQSLLCTMGHIILYTVYLFFSEARISKDPKGMWSRCRVKCLKYQKVIQPKLTRSKT